jgi:hypothetical protein
VKPQDIGNSVSSRNVKEIPVKYKLERYRMSQFAVRRKERE